LAGKKVKCPRCSGLVAIPAAQTAIQKAKVVPGDPEDEIDEVEPLREAPDAAPVRKWPCPECGRKIAVTATRCKFCQSEVEPGDEREVGRRDRDSRFEPCPRCEASDPKKVKMTWWGSFYGAALFHVVRCRECGYSYNGRSGGSLTIPTIFFTVIPAIGIAALIGLIIYLLKSRGHL
jgi:hypothetical protein